MPLAARRLVEQELDDWARLGVLGHEKATRPWIPYHQNLTAGLAYYQRLGLTRQWLHAVRLSFEHPGSGDWVEFVSPYPDDLQHALDLVEADS